MGTVRQRFQPGDISQHSHGLQSAYLLQQFGAYLKAKDETIFVLQQQVKTAKNKRLTQEAIRNYEDIGRSGFHFHPYDMGDVLHSFVIPHIRDLNDQRYYQNLDMATVEAEDLSRAIFMVTLLPKAVKGPIFARNLRDNHASTLPPRVVFPGFYVLLERATVKEQDETLVKLYKDFALVL